MNTEVLPAARGGDPSGTLQTPPSKRRRGWIVALVAGLVVLLGAIGFVVADGVAKAYARDYVSARVAEVLQLPEDARVDVDLGGGSIIVQALTGRIQTVEVDVPVLAVGDISGSAQLHAEGVPLNESAPVDVLRIEVAVGAADLAAIAGDLSGLAVESVALRDDELVVGSTISLFGLPIPIEVALVPAATDGMLVFTARSVSVSGEDFAAEELRSNPLFGALAGALLQPASVCVADRLPQSLVLSGAEIVGEELVLTIVGDGATLGGEGMSTFGSCAP